MFSMSKQLIALHISRAINLPLGFVKILTKIILIKIYQKGSEFVLNMINIIINIKYIHVFNDLNLAKNIFY